MTIAPRKLKQLSAFLGELPEAAAIKLFAALEADRAQGGTDLPHDTLLNDLRRRLHERGAVFPIRQPNAKRLRRRWALRALETTIAEQLRFAHQ